MQAPLAPQAALSVELILLSASPSALPQYLRHQWNWSSSVLPLRAVVDERPPAITCGAGTGQGQG